jgi:UDPglucose 6-dehydrogenase
MQSIGVVGLGVVGGTVARALNDAGVVTRTYDRYLGVGTPEDLSACRVVFVCVSTPAPDGASHDVSQVWDAVGAIEPYLESGTVVAIKSTVSPGTCDELAAAFPNLEFASVPEFLVSANAMQSFTRPDRVIIGARTGEAARRLEEVMRQVAPVAPFLFLRPIEAEIAKLCSNVFLAAKVTVANELYDVCATFGATWDRIQSAVGLDRRIGPDHLTVTAERGFGCGCLPKDLDGFIAAARSAGYEPEVLTAIATFNKRIREERLAEPSIPHPPDANPLVGIGSGRLTPQDWLTDGPMLRRADEEDARAVLGPVHDAEHGG